MSNYISLEDLKKLTAEELRKRWMNRKFPFDMETCCRCVTMHRHHYSETSCEHKDFESAAQLLPKFAQEAREIVGSIETIYSLRLFYKDLYANNPPEIMAEPAPTEERVKEESCLSKSSKSV